ncbi:MAG: pantothenate kinase [Clostridium sp.]|nr:pantothenate kinase [Clostridium sp.]
MKASIGIDIGGSTTKAAGRNETGELIGTLQVTADDPRTCTYGILGRFLQQHNLSLSDVSQITLTGLGSTFFHEDIYGIPTRHMDELTSIARGGLYLSGLSEALIISMGTGTAFIRASKADGFRHLGGSGIGGGTLTGLASHFFHQNNIFTLSDMAMKGSRAMADLRIGDLVDEDVPSLNSELTAANFGKIKSGATENDMAAALFNMIYENIGVMAVFALQGDTIRDVVLTGSLACLPPAEVTFSVFNRMKDVFGVNFIQPPHAAFATAIGSLL